MTTRARHETVEFRPTGGVVVGDDGSACSAAAVRAAAVESRSHGHALHVVRCWSITTTVRPADVPAGMVPSVLEFEAATLAAEERRVKELLEDTGATASVHVVHAPPAKALLVASETADLLVVGTRGRGGFERLLLGSVADQCIRHAACSVLVVRAG
jgi:nucleotide-binding universal stress UspA family protein